MKNIILIYEAIENPILQRFLEIDLNYDPYYEYASIEVPYSSQQPYTRTGDISRDTNQRRIAPRNLSADLRFSDRLPFGGVPGPDDFGIELPELRDTPMNKLRTSEVPKGRIFSAVTAEMDAMF